MKGAGCGFNVLASYQNTFQKSGKQQKKKDDEEEEEESRAIVRVKTKCHSFILLQTSCAFGYRLFDICPLLFTL